MPSPCMQQLQTALKKKVSQLRIHIVRFVSDTCNVMFGEKHNVVALIKDEFPRIKCITFIKCNSHMIHLCVSHVCLKLSTTLEDLCRNFKKF